MSEILIFVFKNRGVDGLPAGGEVAVKGREHMFLYSLSFHFLIIIKIVTIGSRFRDVFCRFPLRHHHTGWLPQSETLKVSLN